jgi:hypothetical protein
MCPHALCTGHKRSLALACAQKPVGVALQGGQLDPIDLLVEERFHRAAPGGNGAVKAAGNYSPVRRGEWLQYLGFHTFCQRQGRQPLLAVAPAA